MIEKNIDDLLSESKKSARNKSSIAKKFNIQTLIDELQLNINEPVLNKVKLPEEIAISFEMTYLELEDKIKKSKNKTLKKKWSIYKERLKIKFAYSNKDTMNDLQSNYNLGVDGKSIPSFNFYLKNTDKQNKMIELLIMQTQLQREKNIKEAKSMGIDVTSPEERRLIEEMIGDIDGSD